MLPKLGSPKWSQRALKKNLYHVPTGNNTKNNMVVPTKKKKNKPTNNSKNDHNYNKPFDHISIASKRS
jgi:hypothetical protein